MLHIDLKEDGLTLNGIFMPEIDPKIFINILGEPRKSEFHGSNEGKAFVRNVLIWDDLGFLINIPATDEQNYSLEFNILADEYLQKNAKFNYFALNPTGFFTGVFTLNGKDVLKTLSKKEIADIYFSLKKCWQHWQICFDLNDTLVESIKPFRYKENQTDKILQLIEHEDSPFVSFWFSPIAPKPKKQAKAKYKLRKATANDLVFDNFNFKLAVINELMYEQGILTPRFDVYDFCGQYTKRDIDPNAYYDEMIPEVRKWFEELPISQALAKKVTRLSFDGGNSIYLELIPQWSGEDDAFDIQQISEREFAQFANLQSIDGTTLMMSESAQLFLKNKGVIFCI